MTIDQVNFDQAKMWHALEDRLAATENPRHRQMLEVVIEHTKAEADCSVERLMATLIDDPQYHFWVRGRDVGPKGRDAVRSYYEQFRDQWRRGLRVTEGPGGGRRSPRRDRSRGAQLRIRRDRHGPRLLRPRRHGSLPRAVPQRRLLRVRGRSGAHALCEDSYTQIDPDAWERAADDDLPPSYVAYLASLA